jgi:hypothetical protein
MPGNDPHLSSNFELNVLVLLRELYLKITYRNSNRSLPLSSIFRLLSFPFPFSYRVFKMASNNRYETGHPSTTNRGIRRMKAYASLKKITGLQAADSVLANLSAMAPTLRDTAPQHGIREEITNSKLKLEYSQHVRDDHLVESFSSSTRSFSQYLRNGRQELYNMKKSHPARYRSDKSTTVQDNANISRHSSLTNRSGQQKRPTKVNGLERLTQTLQQQAQSMHVEHQAERLKSQNLEHHFDNVEQSLADNQVQVEDWKQSYEKLLTPDNDLRTQQSIIEHSLEGHTAISNCQYISELGGNDLRSSIASKIQKLASQPLLASPIKQISKCPCNDLGDIYELADDITPVCKGSCGWDVLDNDRKVQSAYPLAADLEAMASNESLLLLSVNNDSAVELNSSSGRQKLALPDILHHNSYLPRTLRAGFTNLDNDNRWKAKDSRDKHPLHDTPPSSPPHHVVPFTVVEISSVQDLSEVNQTLNLGVNSNTSRSREVIFQFQSPRVEAVPAIHRNRFSSVDLDWLVTSAGLENVLERLRRFDPWNSVPNLTLLDPRVKCDE